MHESGTTDSPGIKLFTEILQQCLRLNASDAHISSDRAVSFRVHGDLFHHQDQILTLEQVSTVVDELLSPARRSQYDESGHVDLGYSLKDKSRFRLNVYIENGCPAIAARYLDNTFQNLDQLHLPQQITQLTDLLHGLVLVCGATGSGKSTTLANLVNSINQNRNCHIITIEDPIEFQHQSEKSLIHQRELGADVQSFSDALRASLRQDPDVIMVGEMRDLDTMKAAITAAETGHLVFSTLHTGDAVGVVERLIGSFPGAEQDVARDRIAASLKAVIAQKLIPIEDGGGRVPAVEILIVTNGVANLITNGKTAQIYSAMESGRKEGMQTLEQSLLDMVRQHWLSHDQAMSYCRNHSAMSKLLSSASGAIRGQGRSEARRYGH
ncbi:MAG: PilT/PilU family type 4a pilus ATPase [Pseudomonadota bacterium]